MAPGIVTVALIVFFVHGCVANAGKHHTGRDNSVRSSPFSCVTLFLHLVLSLHFRSVFVAWVCARVSVRSRLIPSLPVSRCLCVSVAPRDDA